MENWEANGIHIQSKLNSGLMPPNRTALCDRLMMTGTLRAFCIITAVSFLLYFSILLHSGLCVHKDDANCSSPFAMYRAPDETR